MKHLLFLPALVLPLFVLSCDQAPPTEPSAEGTWPWFDTGPPRAASGNVSFVIEGDELASFNFHAVNTPMGAKGGVVLQTSSTRITGNVRCITVVGNEAWVEADIVATNNNFPVALGWWVLDGGAGPPDDKISKIIGFLSEREYCDGMPDLELAIMVSGDIRVR